MRARLDAKYGHQAGVVLKQVEDVLAALDGFEPDWSHDTLESATQRVTEQLAERFPTFPAFIHKAMANYWAFGYK